MESTLGAAPIRSICGYSYSCKGSVSNDRATYEQAWHCRPRAPWRRDRTGVERFRLPFRRVRGRARGLKPLQLITYTSFLAFLAHLWSCQTTSLILPVPMNATNTAGQCDDADGNASCATRGLSRPYLPQNHARRLLKASRAGRVAVKELARRQPGALTGPIRRCGYFVSSYCHQRAAWPLVWIWRILGVASQPPLFRVWYQQLISCFRPVSFFLCFSPSRHSNCPLSTAGKTSENPSRGSSVGWHKYTPPRDQPLPLFATARLSSC